MDMTSQLSKFLITIAQIANGVGAFVLSADAVPFGLDAMSVGLAFVWTGTIATIVVTAIRGNWIPGVTTGVGNEEGVTTTTLEVKETTTEGT